MIVYCKTSGRAHDLRFVDDNYSPKVGEIAIEGWELPDIETLHDPAHVKAREMAAALRDIDSKAGSVRARYITIAPGQEATYILKAAAAETFTSAGYLGAVPTLVQAEATVTGRTPAQAAAAILSERDAWVGKAAQIEQARRAGKIAVGAAATLDALEGARIAALAALDLL